MHTKVKPWLGSYATKFTLLGVLFGLCAPIIATAAEMVTYGWPITLSSFAFIQKKSVLIWIIDTTPFFLGMAGFFIGRKEDEIKAHAELLKNKIQEATGKLHSQKQYFEALLINSPIAVVSLDETHHIVSSNPAFEELFGYTKDEIVGKPLDDLITNEQTYSEATHFTSNVQVGEKVHAFVQRMRKDGKKLDLEMFGVPVMSNGKQQGVLGLYKDISDQIKAEREIRAAKEHAEQLYRVVPSAVFTVDKNQAITSVNEKFVDMLGYQPHELLGKPCTTFALSPCGHSCGLFSDKESDSVVGAECIIRKKDGNELHVLKNALLIRDDQGEITGGIESFEDITIIKKTEEQLKKMATHDSLTGLPNRILFHDRLTHAIQRAKRNKRRTAVLFLDLDNFKMVNDEYGHSMGDTLLKHVARKLQGCLRAADTAARLGGDEFGIVLEDISCVDDARLVARKVMNALKAPMLTNNKEIYITTSIGISIFPDDGVDDDGLLKQADKAMYRAKDMGKNSFEI